MSEIVITKRDAIACLYKSFTEKLKTIIDLSNIFVPVEEIDIADLSINISFMFPLGIDIQKVINELIILHNIQHTDDQLKEALPLIKEFIHKFNQI